MTSCPFLENIKGLLSKTIKNRAMMISTGLTGICIMAIGGICHIIAFSIPVFDPSFFDPFGIFFINIGFWIGGIGAVIFSLAAIAIALQKSPIQNYSTK